MAFATALIMVGVILSLPAAVIGYTGPRREGKPPGAQRQAVLSMSVLGVLCLSVGATMFFAVAR